MLSQRARVCVALAATLDLAVVRFVGRVDVRVFLAVTRVGETAITARVLAYERFFTGMGTLVDFQIFGASEKFSTERDRALKRLFPRVYSEVVDEFVLGLEWLSVALTVLPVTDV